MATLDALLAKPLLQFTRDWDLMRVGGEHGVALWDADRIARVSRRALRTMPQFGRWVVVEPGAGRGRQHLR